MKINKNLLICALLVLVMLCIVSTASATEEPLNENLTATDTGGEIGSMANDELSVSDSHDKLSAAGDTITVDAGGSGDYQTISDAVSHASGGETIFIKNGEYSINTKISPTCSLSIVGESQDGVKITSTGSINLFEMYQSGIALSFKNLCFKDIDFGTKASSALRIGGDSNLDIINCSFIDCKSKNGVMYLYSTGTTNVENCIIKNLTVSASGGSAGIFIAGAGTYNIKNTIIDGSNYNLDSGYAYGIIYFNNKEGITTLDNVTISNCNLNSAFSSGIIYTKSKMIIKNSKINDNKLIKTSTSDLSLIYVNYNSKNNPNAEISVEQSMISNNIASNIIIINNDVAKATVKNCNIKDNTVSSIKSANGVYDLESNYWGSNTLPEGVTASTWIVENNGVYELNTGESIDVTIPGLNDAPEPEFPTDAIYVATDGSDENDGSENAPVANITKAIELAKAGSGNIIITEGIYSQKDITIESDSAISITGKGNVVIDTNGMDSGSVFTINSKDVTIKNIKFINNQANYGVINIVGSSKSDLLAVNVLIENCVFDKSNGKRGGAIYAYYTQGNLTIVNSNFTNSEVSGWGGAICAFQSAYGEGLNVKIFGSNFENNKAYNGGALYIQASALTVTDSTFIKNSAEQSPGAIYLTNITASFDNCKICNNTALKEASAIAVYAGQISTNPTVLKASQLTITNSIIENNTLTQNGAAILVVSSNADISYSSIINDVNINNTVTANYNGDEPETVTANNNWWATNENPISKVDGKNIVIDNWVIMNVEANASEVLVDDNVKITVDFNHVNTTSGEIQDLTGGVIPKTFTVTLTSGSGNLEPANVEVSKGTSKDIIYTVADVDAVVSAQTGDVVKTLSFAKGVEPYYGIIYVDKKGNDSNNGSELFPVESLAKAVELALNPKGSGQIIINEGTYNGANFHLTGNLTVTGKGKVIIDCENNGRLFYMNFGESINELKLTNLTIEHVSGHGGVAYALANSVILDNITVIDSAYGNYLVCSNGNIYVKNSNFTNNTGGDIIQATGKNIEVIINNTEFKNNKITSQYGIIQVTNGVNNLYVEDSKFINNTVVQSVITGSDAQTGIDVKSSEFINNTATVGRGGAIRSNGKLNIFNSTFENNKAYTDGGALYIGSSADATVTKSVFINNIGNTRSDSSYHDSAIYNANKLTLNYCVLLTNKNNYIIYQNAKNDAVNAQYNWWGTNDNPKFLNKIGTYEEDDDYGWGTETYDCADIDVSNWVVMTVSNNLTDEIKIEDKVSFTVDFTHTNTNQELSDSIPEVEVSASAVGGELDTQKQITKNNQAKFEYSAIEGGKDTLTITSSNAVNTTEINVKVPVVIEVIYVSVSGDDNNNGTRSSPVKTLNHAIEIAERGKIVLLEGEHTITGIIKLEKDMNIKGEGTVIVNGNSTKIFNNYANLNLTNIKFTNAISAVGSVVHNQADTLVMINGCEFYSNSATGTTGGIIHIAKGSLNLTDSKFHENTIKRGVVSSVGDTSVLIKDCEFFNHLTTQLYGLVKIDGADLTVENTVFRNNSIGNGAGIYITCNKNNKVIKINNDTFIDNKATQATSGNGAAIFINVASGTADLTISNSKFIDNNAAVNGGAIYTNGNNVDVKVENCTFVNNTAKNGNSIYVNAGKFSISNSVILNDNGVALDYYNQVNLNNVLVDNNFWGDNTKANVADGVKYSNWIIMNASYTTSDEGVLTITATFDKTNSTSGEISDYSGKLPDGFKVTFTSTSGKLNEAVTVKDGKASVDYTRDEYDDAAITVKVANAEVTFPFAVKPSVIYVSTTGNDNNNGDKDSPVATLQQALKLAEKGQIVIREGTYKTGDLGIISDDLTITGEGKVVLDAQNSNRILYVGQDAKIVLKNLIMVNGFGSAQSGALLGNSNELTIINCTLANSSAGENNGGAIYNVGKLTIINSTIANNTARVGGAIFNDNPLSKEPTVTIENSIIENNIANGNDKNGGGAIFAQKIAGLNIVNSTFENNTALTTSNGGAISVIYSNADMKITDSKFIKNHANSQENYGGGAIYLAGEDRTPYRVGTLTISNTLFEDNSADANGGAIYSKSSTVKVENSVFINNTDENGIAVYGYQTEQVSPSITANKNWWGSNDDPSSLIGGNNKYKPTVDNWAILTITNDTEIKDGSTVKLTVAIDSYTDGETVTKMESPIKVPVPVTINTNKGEINGVLDNGEFTYDLDATGITFISANSANTEEVLFANTVSTTIAMDDITALKGDNVEYTVTVTSSDGTAVNKGIVEIYFDNELVKTINVVDGVAKDSIMIAKDIGKYNITAKYIDETTQFGNSEENKTLTVTGVNDIVTPENFNNFFDENGVLKSDVPFDELTFKGEFKDLTITLNRPISVKGDGAVFNNTAVKIIGDEVSVSGIKFTADKEFVDNDGAVIYIGGNNACLADNEIVYNAPENVTSYAITVDIADDVKIKGNTISYSAKSDGSVQTIAVNAREANNLVFENNKLDASIPSVPISYSNYPDNDYYSQAVNIEDSRNVFVNKNDVKVKYTNIVLPDDTIFGVHILRCDDSKVTDNTIDTQGHFETRSLVAEHCQNITISGNDVKSTSDNHLASALHVVGVTTAVVDNNNFSSTAPDVTYPVYVDDWFSDEGQANITNNKIKGEADTVYGIYAEENKTVIANNDISVDGNHVYGIVTHQTDAVIEANNITVNGKDIGSIKAQQSGVDYNTTGIIVSEGSAEISNNNVISTGNSTIIAKNTNATIQNNGLTANGTTADDSITNINSDIKSSGNTEAKKPGDTTPVEPKEPVIKITAKNNAKVYYSFAYTVRVTQDGKSVGAGKDVTLKIAGKTLKAKTNANGYATFKLAVKPKAYTATVTYNGISQKCKVTVKNVIKAKNMKVKKSAKKLRIKVTLKAGKKAIKGKKVILKIKGKKIKAKTNKKGVATFKVKKSILKKLKAGKKYKYQVIYGKDIVKKTLKVKR